MRWRGTVRGVPVGKQHHTAMCNAQSASQYKKLGEDDHEILVDWSKQLNGQTLKNTQVVIKPKMTLAKISTSS
jgi:hypothetical protein